MVFSNSKAVVPYQNESSANAAEEMEEEEDEDGDKDGITPDTLAARFDGKTAVNDWLVDDLKFVVEINII